MRFLVTKPSIQHILWDNTCNVIEGKPQSKTAIGTVAFWTQQLSKDRAGGIQPLALHTSEDSPWRFQSRDLELCLAAHKLPALPSHLLYGCWQHKPTFFLATSPEPLCDAGPMSRNLSAPQSQFFFPPTFPGCWERQPRETARPRSLTHSLCAQEDLRGLSQHKWFHGSKWRDVTVQLIQTVTDSSHSQDSRALRLERHFQNKEQNTITDGKQRFFFFFFI